MAMRWVVGPADGSSVRDVLQRACADAQAVPEGRVFLGRKRVRRDDEPVRPGDVIEVAPPRAAPVQQVAVVGETPDLLAVAKPAGIPTIADHAGSSHALLAQAARALRVPEASLYPTSRLDRDVSGVVVFARTAAAAGRLKQARAEGRYVRRYVALTMGELTCEEGTWDAPIGRADLPRLRAASGRNPTPARTRYAVCARAPADPQPLARERIVMLAVSPMTGRTHQIRVHAAHAGAPLIGDRDYGGPARVVLPTGRVVEPRRIALHAARVVVPGQDGAPLTFSAAVPSDLADLWRLFRGEAPAWEDSIERPIGVR